MSGDAPVAERNSLDVDARPSQSLPNTLENIERASGWDCPLVKFIPSSGRVPSMLRRSQAC